MQEDLNIMIKIIKEEIEKYEEVINNLQTVNNSVLSINKKELDEFRNDNNKILDIDFDIIIKVLDEVETDNQKRENIIRYLYSIKTLLSLNKERNTTFKIQDNQLQYINLFFEEVDKLTEKNRNIQNHNLKSLGKISTICNKYRNLLDLLEDENNNVFIADLDLINQIFDEAKVDLTTRKNILFAIMKYNKNIVDRDLENDTISFNVKRNNKEDLINLFKKYDYDFLELHLDQQEVLIKYGNLNNMEKLFITLDNLSFPRFDLAKDDLKLTAILINCNKDVLENVVAFSIQKGLSLDNLTSIIPALIPQTPYNKRYNQNNHQKELQKVIIAGKSDDYFQNIEFLESVGFDIKRVFEKCRGLLIMPHTRLINNYNTFKEYGFTFDKDSENRLFNPAFSCLLANNFAEIADQFIEICDEGHNYICQNMSRLSTISSPHDIILYNIYRSFMSNDEYGVSHIPEGPFVNRNAKRLKLRGEITRYPGSGYERIPYCDIEDYNKMRKTKTISVVTDNKDIFDADIRRAKEEEYEIPNVLTMTDLQELEQYTDINDPIRYKLNNKLISKLKVRRIFNILKYYNHHKLDDALLYALTYNSIINAEDFNDIKNTISHTRRK